MRYVFLLMQLKHNCHISSVTKDHKNVALNIKNVSNVSTFKFTDNRQLQVLLYTLM